MRRRRQIAQQRIFRRFHAHRIHALGVPPARRGRTP
jgi:hypothetical protein